MQAVMPQSVDSVVASANRSQLAREMGLDRAYVSRVLARKQEPGLGVAARLARGLGVSLDGLAEYLAAEGN